MVDKNSYTILYRDSKNLKYIDRSNEPQASESTFSEYNPFKGDSDENIGPPPATIHKVYNKWVANLENKINTSLRELGTFSTTRSKRITTETSSCSDSPEISVTGQAKISRSSVNLRSGARTKCAIVGNISKSETLTLLGKKNNWYYISRSQGASGWLYAPLVTILSNQAKQTIQVAAVSTPPPPAPPRKKISIAVIEFKT